MKERTYEVIFIADPNLSEPDVDALTTIAATQRRSVGALVAELDAERMPEQPLASALRVFALGWFRGT